MLEAYLLMIQDHMPLCYDNEIQIFFVSPFNFSFYGSRIGRIAVIPVLLNWFANMPLQPTGFPVLV